MAQAPDLSDLFGGQPTSTTQTPNSSSSSLGDLFGGSSSVAQNTSTPALASPASSSSSLGDLFGTPSSSSEPSASEAPKFDYQDPSKSWYSRAWSWLNTPLSESLFGLPEDRPGAGGFERGLEHVVSGLTSPLSIALGLATFGTGSIIDSAGLTALKESGEFTAEQIADITKASQTALDALKAQKPLEPVLGDALAAGGHDPELLLRANKVFGDTNRVTELAKPEIQRNLAMVGLKTTPLKTLSGLRG
jgi:hypothetical protein